MPRHQSSQSERIADNEGTKLAEDVTNGQHITELKLYSPLQVIMELHIGRVFQKAAANPSPHRGLCVTLSVFALNNYEIISSPCCVPRRDSYIPCCCAAIYVFLN